MRTPLVAGNWKMNTSLAEARALAAGVKEAVSGLEHVETVLCPPFVWLSDLSSSCIAPGELSNLKLGAQNMHFEERGTFTGEISPLMVKEVAEYVILGHSDRTHIFGEGPELVARKIESAFEHGLTPIVCVGEDAQEDGSKEKIVRDLEALIGSLLPEQLDALVVAYEPIWAISNGNVSAGHPASPEYAQEIISALRTRLTANTRILYGGSSSPDNIESYMDQPDIDGVLSGGASLRLKDFAMMIHLADDLSRNRN